MILQYQLALDDCNKAISIDKYNTKAYVRSAKALKGLGKLDNAINVLNEYLKNDNNNDHVKKDRDTLRFELKREIGNSCFKENKYNEAINNWTECINIDPNNKDIALLYCNKALAYSKMGKNELAVDDSSKAIELDPSFTKAYMRRADCNYALGGEKRFENCIDDNYKVLELLKSECVAKKDAKKKILDAKMALKSARRKRKLDDNDDNFIVVTINMNVLTLLKIENVVNNIEEIMDRRGSYSDRYSDNRPDIIFIQETKLSEQIFTNIKNTMMNNEYPYEIFHNPVYFNNFNYIMEHAYLYGKDRSFKKMGALCILNGILKVVHVYGNVIMVYLLVCTLLLLIKIRKMKENTKVRIF